MNTRFALRSPVRVGVARVPAKRAYTMGARAEAMAATRARIVGRATELFLAHDYDAVSLERIAKDANVSLQTVLRQFGSKDALLLACARERGGDEKARRRAVPGDLHGIARVLAARYEQQAPSWRALSSLEVRFPAIAEAVDIARRGHHEWLQVAFAPFLPARDGTLRRRRLAELFGATEIYVWWSWRQKLGLDAREAELALLETLEALTERWAVSTRRAEKQRRKSHG